MRILQASLLGAMMFIGTYASAQVTPQPPKLGPKRPPVYVLTLDASDLGNLDQAIQNLPFRTAKPLIDKIDAQIREQIDNENKPIGSEGGGGNAHGSGGPATDLNGPNLDPGAAQHPGRVTHGGTETPKP